MGDLSSLTPLAIAALALLVERPMHPYEMYTVLMQRSEDRIVKVRPGSLYHTMDKLAQFGLVVAVSTEREGNRPERTTYDITDRGRRVLNEVIAEIIAIPVNEYPRFPVAVAEAHNLPRDMVVDLLRRRQDELHRELAYYESGRSDLVAKGIPRVYWLDVTYRQAMLEAEVAWIDRVIADIHSGDIPWNTA